MRIGQTFSTIDDILNEFDGDELPTSIVPSDTTLWFNWEDHSYMVFGLDDSCNYWVLEEITQEDG
jgi:hypothetical protein